MSNFTKDLAKGKIGESLIAEAWPELKPLNGRKSDFVNELTGELVELKTESRSLAQTPNFFIETISNMNKGTSGGPWRALEDGSTVWMYFFKEDNTVFIFDTKKLINWLETTKKEYRFVTVRNPGYTTEGMLVPRSDLAHLYEVRKLK